MRYALLIYAGEDATGSRPEEALEALHGRCADYSAWLQDRGWIRGGEQLAATSSATCVRVEGGRTVATDGPYAETEEQLGGFYLIECQNLDQAIEAAARVP